MKMIDLFQDSACSHTFLCSKVDCDYYLVQSNSVVDGWPYFVIYLRLIQVEVKLQAWVPDSVYSIQRTILVCGMATPGYQVTATKTKRESQHATRYLKV